MIFLKGDSKHHITHFQYLEWPDFGVPSSTESLLFFCHKVRERVEFDGGLIAVHCRLNYLFKFKKSTHKKAYKLNILILINTALRNK